MKYRNEAGCESKNPKRTQAILIRAFRKTHRTIGLLLIVFIFFISATGLLLGWKKHSDGIIIPKSYSGTSTDFKDWLPLDSLHTLACAVLRDSVSDNLSQELQRVDIRKSKGMLKFVFSDHLWEVQLDGATGNPLNVGRRYSDLLENLHDGSVLDDLVGTKNGQLKLIYSSIMGLAFLVLTITGFWLWFGVKRIRRGKKKLLMELKEGEI